MKGVCAHKGTAFDSQGERQLWGQPFLVPLSLKNEYGFKF
jgi:hypothetical protein